MVDSETLLCRSSIDATPRERTISGVEMCFAVLIVIAHNVYHWIPNEVPILVVLAMASSRIREGKWISHLYRLPVSWSRTFWLAVLAVILLEGKDMILEPLGNYFWPGPQHVSSVITRSNDLSHTLLNLLFVWVFAAFGEEIGYRGYLLRRSLHAFGQTRWATALALLVASAAFGIGHFYKGGAGMLESTGSGLILGGIYLFSRRLWASTIAHGLNDTLAILLIYSGW